MLRHGLFWKQTGEQKKQIDILIFFYLSNQPRTSYSFFFLFFFINLDR